jgi:uncharacterized protein (TIGR02646 family)
MIRVRRPAEVPGRLTRAETEACRVRLRDRVSADRTAFLSGGSTFSEDDFDRGIYGHASVKEALSDAQHGKCAWCERSVAGGGGSFGDVEHYRPKGRVSQQVGRVGNTPGYYWLAYSWENLLLSCQHCNQRYKKDLFPLANPAKRARVHDAVVTDELPLLLDPAKEGDDPRRHIVFRDELPVGRSPAGCCTIKLLQLDRDPDEVRADRWKDLSGMATAFRLLQRHAAASPEFASGAEYLLGRLRAACEAQAAFSSMAEDLLRDVLDQQK